MIFGTTPLTFVHVLLSLVGIVTGLVVIAGMLRNQRMEKWTAVFLATTVATSVTGFLFPITGLTPGIKIGIVSLVLLTLAIAGRYGCDMAGFWRPVYVICAVMSEWLNVVVLVVQSFMKISFLHELAPKQEEPPFLVTQAAVLVAFVVLGILATLRFRPLPPLVAKKAAA